MLSAHQVTIVLVIARVFTDQAVFNSFGGATKKLVI